MLVSVISDSADYLLVSPATFKGEWIVPAKYVNRLEEGVFQKLVFVDRTNQNAVTLERGDTTWLIRSMNPITSGVKRPPFYWETPVGIYVVIGKLEKMFNYHVGPFHVHICVCEMQLHMQNLFLTGHPSEKLW